MKIKILVIRFRRVGDAVLSSTICSTLKQSIPNSEIHYVLNQSIAPLFENHPAIDKLITFEENEKKSIVKYAKKIRALMKREKYDIIIDARSTINTSFFALFSSNSKYRIGRKKKYTKFIYNYRVVNDMKGIDNVQQLLKLVEPLEKEYAIIKDPAFKLYCTKEEKESFKEYMSKSGIDFLKPIIICAVCGRVDSKVYPSEYMSDILHRILNNYSDAQLVFNYGGDKEAKYAKELHSIMNNDPRIFTNIEAKDLRELAAMMDNSNFFFGNEGGPRHISQAFDIPSFAIYSPGIDMGVWLPNRSDRFQGICLEDIDKSKLNDPNLSHEDKFKLITPDKIWGKLDPMLKKYL